MSNVFTDMGGVPRGDIQAIAHDIVSHWENGVEELALYGSDKVNPWATARAEYESMRMLIGELKARIEQEP